MDLLKERQRDRRNAELEAEKEAKRLALLQEENERKEAERLRLEQQYRDKRNEKDKLRIQRQREEGSYLTKNARQKYLRAQVQLGAAGVDVPTRHAIQLKGANTDESDRKRILYDDRRKANRTGISIFHKLTSFLINFISNRYSSGTNSNIEGIRRSSTD